MKKTLNLLLTALLFLGFAACEKPQTDEETKEPNTENTDKPGPGEDEGNKDDNGEENENEGNENEGNQNNCRSNANKHLQGQKSFVGLFFLPYHFQ